MAESSQSLAEIDPASFEPLMLSMPQVDCPLVHHFGPGLYVREVTIPAGAIAMGHAQRYEHLNIVLKGAVVILDGAEWRTVRAPAIFVGKPGRKFGYCLEECVWQNIFVNPDNERDISVLEDRYFDKSAVSEKFQELLNFELSKEHIEDREDFALMLSEFGFTPEQAKAESEYTGDMVPVPDAYASRLSIRNSPIEGKGLFLSFPAKEGEIIAPARIDGGRTVAGRWVNHAKNPNCFYEQHGNTIFLVAKRDISGAKGGSPGDELTVDYRESMKFRERIMQ
jgi:hypothetical protein